MRTLKPPKPKPTIIIDTREQQPWKFSDKVYIERQALATGDYSVKGLEHLITVERKSMDDYVGSIVDSLREDDPEDGRFFRELQRMENIPYRSIVIEQPFSDLVCGRYQSFISPAAISSKTMSFELRQGISVRFFEDRFGAAKWTEEFLSKFWRIRKDELNPKKIRGDNGQDHETIPEGVIPGWCK